MSPTRLSAELASGFARIALGHVTREYPNILVHVVAGPRDIAAPRALHPVFFGSLDWHSCVHGHWLLARLLRLHPEIPESGAIVARFDAAFTADGVAGEIAYLARPSSAGFERPYGWAWLLMLAAELSDHPHDQTGAWSGTLRPLAEAFAARFKGFLPRCDYPVRAGVHSNSAFALALSHRYALAVGDGALARLVETKAHAWYGSDTDCQVWEPSGDDFLSPALMEAELMRRLMGRDDFRDWFDRFLPAAANGEPAALFEPARVSDRSDGKIAHLDGLNLSRAWCWRGIAGAFGRHDSAAQGFEEAAQRHIDASLSHVSGDYMGEHWLASFALLALDAA